VASTVRRTMAAALLLTGCAWFVLVLTVEGAQGATNTRIPTATRFQPSSSTLQAVVVKSTWWTDTHALVETWERTSASARWTLKRRAGGRVGYNGMSAYRKQNSGKTPAGMFALGPMAFGNGPSPGTHLAWRTVKSNDYWVLDASHQPSFNRYLTRKAGDPWRTSEAERLASFKTQYRYAVVVGWNKPNTGRSTPSYGGGIFLHVNGRGATAGCVSVPHDRMASITRWLDPAKHPVIVIGEDNWLVGRNPTR
jgi:L,D-peptidoglycan transpeptidase YkuD (ErfK/YbiS/YcfS/YnhG family)